MILYIHGSGISHLLLPIILRGCKHTCWFPRSCKHISLSLIGCKGSFIWKGRWLYYCFRWRGRRRGLYLWLNNLRPLLLNLWPWCYRRNLLLLLNSWRLRLRRRWKCSLHSLLSCCRCRAGLRSYLLIWSPNWLRLSSLRPDSWLLCLLHLGRWLNLWLWRCLKWLLSLLLLFLYLLLDSWSMTISLRTLYNLLLRLLFKYLGLSLFHI